MLRKSLKRYINTSEQKNVKYSERYKRISKCMFLDWKTLFIFILLW